MRVFAIGDPHLSLSGRKPMHRFGPSWFRHADRMLKRAWQTVHENDVLLLPGDLSWATKRRDATVDLDYLSKFPGTKICIKGNHDYWWESDRPIGHPPLLSPPVLLDDGRIGIAGTRGWDMSDGKLVERERQRLRKSLAAIADCPVKIAMLHYPPHPFIDLLVDAGVSVCVYGHVHVDSLPADEALVLDGELFEGIVCHCVPCDRIGFTPRQIR